MRFTIILFLSLATLPMLLAAPAPTVRIPVAGPQLDYVPGPVTSTTNLPAPASWPVLRYEKPLRVLAITWKGGSAASYQRICRRLRASLDIRYIGGGDDRYHVNDKWIEPSNNPTAEELTKYTVKVAIDATAAVEGKYPYDVIFCDNPANILQESVLQDNLLKFMTAGGIVVVCGNYYPPTESLLAPEWPAKPTPQNSWMQGGAQRLDGAPLSGLPLSRLAGHNWIPLAQVAPGATALATGEAGATFIRTIGKGTLLYSPLGTISRKYDAIAALGRKYDHDEIWLRLWDQALYTLARGETAIPAYTDLRASGKEALPGQDYVLPAKIVNRNWRKPLTIAVQVTTPHGKVVYTREQSLTVDPGSEQALDVRIPVQPEWEAGVYPVYLTIGDAASKRQFQQSLEYIPVVGQLDLALTSAKKGYRLGEDAQFTLTASSRIPWDGKLAFGVYDFRGRLLAVSVKPVQLTPEKQEIPFSYRLADHGVRVDTLWAQVAAVSMGKEFGCTEVKFYKYEPWSMRNEYQWSTWAGIACSAPSLTPIGMQLMAHAGMNALGYPGRSELNYAAERWGWHYYNESIGMNTFSPVIEYENEAEIEQALAKEAQNAANSPELTSAAFVLGSVGEEAGFKNGWGTRYYWDTPVAPEKACKALQWYLKTKYPGLEQLNTTWRTAYQTWDEIKLTKEFSGSAPKLDADGWARPKDSPIGAGATGVSLAPYLDTADFYNWYYDKIIAVARRILQERINPVTRIMSSAPTIGSADYDARLTGPSGWNESQSYSINDGPEPGFGLIWGHFDWSVMTDNMFWGFLLTRSGHNNYWVDIPLMFNNDMSHTRASFAMRRWTHRLAGHERIILDSKPLVSEVGVLGANGLSQSQSPGNMTTSTKVALTQGGFGFADADLNKLGQYKAVFAVCRQALSQAQAEKLNAYVEAGGTLVFTPRFANQTELGAPQQVSPGWGLAAKWGLTVTEKTDPIPQYADNTSLSCKLDGLGDALKGLVISGQKVYREKVQSDGWNALASYADNVPAVLTRPLGKGRLIFLNAVYQSHWYIQWVTPTGVERQGYYKFIEWACAQAGARRTLRLDGNLNETLHMAVKQFTDPTGHIHYVIARTNGEVPWTNGKLNWLGEGSACYDVLAGEIGKPSPVYGKEVALNLQPGAGKLLAFVRAPLKGIRVKATPAQITAGQPLRVTVSIIGTDGKAVPGSFPLELHATSSQGEIAGLARSHSLANGESMTLNTALNDPVGTWMLTLTDGISGLSGSAVVKVLPAKTLASAPGYTGWGWPSEVQEPVQMSPDEFLGRLRRLTALYQQDHSQEGWMTKQYLGYYYEYFPNTRHDLLRPLNDMDWTAYTAAIRQAVNAGDTFILTGEDVGIDPGSGLGTWPYNEGKQLAALATALAGAQWTLATRDGDSIAATLGKGKVILCRESIDAAGNTNPELVQWQLRWLGELGGGASNGLMKPTAIAAPHLQKLLRWWVGIEAITPAPRTVSWFAGNAREVKLTLDPAKPLGETFTLLLPPTGTVKSVDFSLKGAGTGTVVFDVGCDDVPDGEMTTCPAAFTPAAKATTVKWGDAVTRYLAWRTAGSAGPCRDGNGWRIVPVRVTATGKVELTISEARIIVQ